jgi:xanthine dehydrogenase accessory factor
LDLGGRTPAETALAIMAEIVAARYGGTGLLLRDKARIEVGRMAATAAPAPLPRA